MKCEIKDCLNDAMAGNKCWEHHAVGYQPMGKKLSADGLPLPYVKVPPQPTADTGVSDTEIDRAIERLRLENDFFKVSSGGMTMHLFVKDLKKIGIWTIITCLFQVIILWVKNKTMGKTD